MFKNKKIQIRLSEELHEFLHKQTENASLFIRNIIREKMKKGFDADDLTNAFEIRARTPYVYLAELYRVIDGDTLLLNIDLGFFTTMLVKIRLCGINTPPLETADGKKAKDFVEKELKGASLIVETRKKGKYGRYLAYIYYHPTHNDFENIIRYGKCLNSELLEKGLAEKYVKGKKANIKENDDTAGGEQEGVIYSGDDLLLGGKIKKKRNACQ